MPKAIHIDDDSSTVYLIDEPDGSYVLDEDSQVSVGSAPAISITASATSSTLSIVGRALASSGAGISVAAADSRIIVGKTGFVTGIVSDVTGRLDVENHGLIYPNSQTGILFQATSGSIVNSGDIIASNVAILSIGDIESLTVTNSGFMSASTGIAATASNLKITLARTSEILATGVAINIASDNGSVARITNNGVIDAHGHGVFQGGAGDETFRNAGTVYGNDMVFQDGNDTYIEAGGTYAGRVYGGMGNDRYVLNSRQITIFEENGGGDDRIETSVSYSLVESVYVETLKLTGRSNLNASGNDLDQHIIGNTGNNRLAGHNGSDVLTGGGGKDVFVFEMPFQAATVTDFEQGKDHIEFSKDLGFSGFADLRLASADGDVIISSNFVNDIVLEHARIQDFSRADFTFV